MEIKLNKEDIIKEIKEIKDNWFDQPEFLFQIVDNASDSWSGMRARNS